MRLITHNLLCCNVKTCVNADTPLQLIIEKSEIVEKDFEPKTVLKLLEWLNWDILAAVALQVTPD
jgi:multifunctional methyltransferase subunit TRM112